MKPGGDDLLDNLGQSVFRAFRVLEALSVDGPSRVGDVADSVGLHKSTVHRLLHLLQRQGYVTQDPDTREYRLTLRLFEIGCRVVTATGLREKAFPLMQGLMNLTGETVWLSVPEGTELVHIEKVESQEVVRLTSPIGTRRPLYATAAGKAILSGYWPSRWRKLYVSGDGSSVSLPRLTERTIIDYDQLDRELAGVVQQGFAIDDGESTVGVRAIAAPVFDYRGNIVAALSVAGLEVRLPLDRLPELGRAIVAAARQLEVGTRGHGRMAPRMPSGTSPTS